MTDIITALEDHFHNHHDQGKNENRFFYVKKSETFSHNLEQFEAEVLNLAKLNGYEILNSRLYDDGDSLSTLRNNQTTDFLNLYIAYDKYSSMYLASIHKFVPASA